ncbi:hypothetical protein HDU97_001366 [Phlyctochytrium planicorne]|nr:hypothetical protein HDU97_001366 [Phlyctochytrium planicorne]
MVDGTPSTDLVAQPASDADSSSPPASSTQVIPNVPNPVEGASPAGALNANSSVPNQAAAEEPPSIPVPSSSKVATIVQPFDQNSISNATSNFGTGNPPWQSTTVEAGMGKELIHNIAALPSYVTWSPEELRLQDYGMGKRSAANVFTQHMRTMTEKLFQAWDASVSGESESTSNEAEISEISSQPSHAPHIVPSTQTTGDGNVSEPTAKVQEVLEVTPKAQEPSSPAVRNQVGSPCGFTTIRDEVPHSHFWVPRFGRTLTASAKVLGWDTDEERITYLNSLVESCKNMNYDKVCSLLEPALTAGTKSREFRWISGDWKGCKGDAFECLFYACVEGQKDIVEALLSFGSEFKDDTGNSIRPFHKLLNEKKLNWTSDLTPFMACGRAGKGSKLVAYLLKEGGDVTIRDNRGFTILTWAAYWNDAESTKILIEATRKTMFSLDRNAFQIIMDEALEVALRSHGYDAVDALIGDGQSGKGNAVVQIGKSEEFQLLSRLTVSQLRRMFGNLVDKDAKNHRNFFLNVLYTPQRTGIPILATALPLLTGDLNFPIHTDLAASGKLSLVHYVCRSGTEKEVWEGGHVDDYSINNGNRLAVRKETMHLMIKDLISLLRRRNADLQEIDPISGLSPLHVAVLESNQELTKILLSEGADPNILSKKHLASEATNIQAVTKETRQLAKASKKKGQKNTGQKTESSSEPLASYTTSMPTPAPSEEKPTEETRNDAANVTTTELTTSSEEISSSNVISSPPPAAVDDISPPAAGDTEVTAPEVTALKPKEEETEEAIAERVRLLTTWSIRQAVHQEALTPLHCVSNTAVADLLLKFGADSTIRTSLRQWLPLHCVCSRLVEDPEPPEGSKPKARWDVEENEEGDDGGEEAERVAEEENNDDGETSNEKAKPVIQEREHSCIKIVKSLTSSEIPEVWRYATDCHGRTALHIAALDDTVVNRQACLLLLQRGIAWTIEDKSKSLAHAVSTNDIRYVILEAIMADSQIAIDNYFYDPEDGIAEDMKLSTERKKVPIPARWTVQPLTMMAARLIKRERYLLTDIDARVVDLVHGNYLTKINGSWIPPASISAIDSDVFFSASSFVSTDRLKHSASDLNAAAATSFGSVLDVETKLFSVPKDSATDSNNNLSVSGANSTEDVGYLSSSPLQKNSKPIPSPKLRRKSYTKSVTGKSPIRDPFLGSNALASTFPTFIPSPSVSPSQPSILSTGEGFNFTFGAAKDELRPEPQLFTFTGTSPIPTFSFQAPESSEAVKEQKADEEIRPTLDFSKEEIPPVPEDVESALSSEVTADKMTRN